MPEYAPLLLVIVSGLLCVALSGLVRKYAVRRGILDRPNDRSSHIVDTPRGGGLAIMAASAVAVFMGAAMGAAEWGEIIVVISGSLVLAAVGWLDDRRETGVAAGARLAVHFLVAAATIALFRGFDSLHLGATSVKLGVAGSVLATIAIAWSINLFNFMDGIDGLASSQAALILGAIATLSAVKGDESSAVIAGSVAAACVGFLVWNWPPAKIFLGDVGSGPLGYFIATLALAAERRAGAPALAIAGVYALFVADATVTLLRRLANGERPAQGHRDHAYQRLARAWGGHRGVTIGAAAFTAAFAAAAAVPIANSALLVPYVAAVYVVTATLLILIERRAPLRSVAPHNESQAAQSVVK